MELIPLLLLAPVMVAVAYADLRYLRIPNILGLAALALFVLTAPLLTWGELGWRMTAAAIVFGVSFAMFALRLIGGGDVKIIAALMLFIPSQTHALFALNFSASLLLGIALILTLRAAPIFQNTRFVSIKTENGFPMGISIALSGILHPFLVSALA